MWAVTTIYTVGHTRPHLVRGTLGRIGPVGSCCSNMEDVLGTPHLETTLLDIVILQAIRLCVKLLKARMVRMCPCTRFQNIEIAAAVPCSDEGFQFRM